MRLYQAIRPNTEAPISLSEASFRAGGGRVEHLLEKCLLDKAD